MFSTARRPRVLATLGATFLATLATAGAAHAAGNAGYTTYDPAHPDTCLAGSVVNCNQYTTKESVFVGGGPSGGNGLDDGQYFFAVIAPGAQNTFLSGTGLLSTDSQAERTFTEAGGVIGSYDGTTHAVTAGANQPKIISLAPYNDTPNPGGVYILAVCSVGAASPSDCKFDAFKVSTKVTPPGQADALSVTKTAVPTYKVTYPWSLSKVVDKTSQTGFGNLTFFYGITATKGAGVPSDYALNGVIKVVNINLAPVDHVTVTDTLDDATGTCSVVGGADISIGAGETAMLPYSCTFSAKPSFAEQTNTATATYAKQTLSDGTLLDAGAPTGIKKYMFGNGEIGNPTVLDDCTTVSDPMAPANVLPKTICASQTFNYSKAFPAPADGCTAYTNVATSKTADLGLIASDTQTVKVCAPPRVLGGHTIGFWQNKNGQAIIKAGTTTNKVCDAVTYLRGLGLPPTPTVTGPFDDLSATATCATLASYFVTAFNNASAGGATANAMLKAQMLSTALSYYFRSAIGAPATVTTLKVDLLHVPGAGDVSSAFGGATSMTIQGLLDYAAQQSTAVGGSNWYGQVKATQILAKTTFDAINNQIAYQAI